jgi:hypothetical protein
VAVLCRFAIWMAGLCQSGCARFRCRWNHRGHAGCGLLRARTADGCPPGRTPRPFDQLFNRRRTFFHQCASGFATAQPGVGVGAILVMQFRLIVIAERRRDSALRIPASRPREARNAGPACRQLTVSEGNGIGALCLSAHFTGRMEPVTAVLPFCQRFRIEDAERYAAAAVLRFAANRVFTSGLSSSRIALVAIQRPLRVPRL